MISFVRCPPRAIRTSKEPTIASRASRASCTVDSNRLSSDGIARRRRCRRAPPARDGSARRAPSGARRARGGASRPRAASRSAARCLWPSASPRIAWMSNSSRRCSIRSNAAEYAAEHPLQQRGEEAGAVERARVAGARDPLDANSSSTGIGSSCAVITQFLPTTHSSAISSPSSSSSRRVCGDVDVAAVVLKDGAILERRGTHVSRCRGRTPRDAVARPPRSCGRGRPRAASRGSPPRRSASSSR